MSAAPRETRRVAAWGLRGRIVAGFNAVASLALALAATALVNYLAWRHFHARADLGSRRFYELSEKTLRVLASLREDVRVYVVFRASTGEKEETVRDVMNLLEEYRHAAGRIGRNAFAVERVDPDRDLARMEALRSQHDVRTADVVVVAMGKKSRAISERALVEYEPPALTPGAAVKRERKAFHGEEVISSVLLGMTQEARKRVLFLKGHSEHEIDDFAPNTGYSEIARALRQENLEVGALSLTDPAGPVSDADLLVVGGPRRALHKSEVGAIRALLNGKANLLVLIDARQASGLEPLLEEWGVGLPDERVVEKMVVFSVGADGVVGLPATDEELYVQRYGAHPITRPLKGVTTALYLPRPVVPLETAPASAGGEDRSRVTVLAACSENGWAETNPRQEPPRYDPGVDRRGPIPVAVAAERAPARGVNVALRPRRLVVIGDSDFVVNGRAAGGNEDFFLSAVGWLLERETLLGVGPKEYDRIPLRLDERQRFWLFVVTVVAMPGAVALLGLGVWLRRMR